jgi:hypothetical protein
MTTSFTWDVLGHGGLGLIGRITSGGTRTYAHQDGLGSTRLVTDSSGAVVGTTQYDALVATRTNPARRRNTAAGSGQLPEPVMRYQSRCGG